jgi:hypothetical protein
MVLYSRQAFGIFDTLWLYTDNPSDKKYYEDCLFYDTCRSMSINQMYEVDTGDSYDGSSYINFDYQFSSDTMKVFDTNDSSIIYSDYRPGYAGFKAIWDYGVVSYSLAKFESLIFAHKGPLPNHKITFRMGYRVGFGNPTVFHTLGSVSASDTWKVDTIVIPDFIKKIPECAATARGYYEMQVLVTNADQNDTSKSSIPANLKLDNIMLFSQSFGTFKMADQLWLYKDLPIDETIWNTLQFSDTCRTFRFDRMYPTADGDRYDGSYIDFRYRFSAETLFVADTGFADSVVYKDYRPGYAGFRINWDYGSTGYPLEKYDYLILAHKGPLPDHRATIRFGYHTNCDSTVITYQTIGSFKASTYWKMDTLVIPDSVRALSDSVRNVRMYYEMQILITNADPDDTNKTSVEGSLMIDDISLSVGSVGMIRQSKAGNRSLWGNTFSPQVSGSVQYAIYLLNGTLLYSASVNVAGGKKYTLGSLMEKHAIPVSSGIRCVVIKGAGLDIFRKMPLVTGKNEP